MQRLIYDEHALDDYGGDIEQWLYDGLVGAAMGGIGGAVDIVNGEYAAKNDAARRSDFNNALNQASEGFGTLKPVDPLTKQAAQAKTGVDYLVENAQGQKNNASETETGNTSETVAVIDLLKGNIPNLENNSPVALTNSDIVSQTPGNTIAEKARALFSKIIGKVSREGFGEVEITSRSMKDDLSHGIGAAKAAVIPTIPEVIKNGQQIDFQQQWKGRPYDGYVFAAPVEMDGRKVYVAAIVKKTSKNRFYLHEVVDSDGNIIKINGGEKANLTSLSSVDDTGTFSPRGTPTQGVNAETVVSDTNVPENGGNVKSESGLSESSAKGIEYAAKSFGADDDNTATAASDSSGRKYIIAGGLVFAVTDDAYNHASENPTGAIPGVTVEKKEAPIKMLDKYAADEYQKVTEPPIEATASNGKNAIVFKKANGVNVCFDAEYISTLDGAEFYIETGRKQPQIKAVDENGNLIGYALPMNVSIDESTIKPTNLKAFANDAQNAAEATNVQEGVNTQANAESANSGQNTALNNGAEQGAPKTGADALFETVQGTQTQGTQEQGTAQGAQQGAQSDVGEPMKPTYNKDAPPANGESAKTANGESAKKQLLFICSYGKLNKNMHVFPLIRNLEGACFGKIRNKRRFCASRRG